MKKNDETNKRLDELERKMKYLEFKERYGDGYKLETVYNDGARNNVSVEYASRSTLNWRIIKLQTDRAFNYESVYPSIYKTDNFTFLILKTRQFYKFPKIEKESEGIEFYNIDFNGQILIEVNKEFFENAGGKVG